MRLEHDGDLDWNGAAALFEKVGWGRRNPQEVRAAFERSTFKVFAYDGEELVGFGRTIDDGRYYATLVDVVVAPSQRRRGFGRAIVKDLVSRSKGFLVVTLTAAPEVRPFLLCTRMARANDGDDLPALCGSSRTKLRGLARGDP